MVREHPDNRMAFEYLVTWELLGRNLDSLPLRVPGFRSLGYQSLPQAFEEALILCASAKEPKPDNELKSSVHAASNRGDPVQDRCKVDHPLNPEWWVKHR